MAGHRGQPRLERRHRGRTPGAASGQPLLRTAAADLRFDRIDDLQAFDYLVRERRLRRLVHLDKFASGVSKTEGELNGATMAAGKRL